MARAKKRRVRRAKVMTSSSYETRASALAADIWNRLIHLPQFHLLQPKDYPELYDVVAVALKREHRP
jgi:hypothetical protein